MGDLPVPEQTSEHCQGVLGQHRVDEALLPLKRLKRAAARLAVVVERGVDNLREQFSGCP